MKSVQIPEKLYFKIGEVARLADVKPYVLRYWETEFKEINPVKSRSKQRLYRRKDVEIVLWIKRLLYEEGFTIEGARRQIRSVPQLSLSLQDGKKDGLLRKLKGELEDLLQMLQK